MHGTTNTPKRPVKTNVTFLFAAGCIWLGGYLMLSFTRMLLGYIGLAIACVGVVAAVRWFFLGTE